MTSFAKNKPEVASLQQWVEQESEVFLRTYLQRCFDLSALDNYVYDHVHSYTKDIHRSAKQKHHKWAEKLSKDLIAVRANADKFMVQIGRLSADRTATGRNGLLERVIAAEKYFIPLITGFSENIFERMELVKQDKQVLEFLNELLEMESLFFEQLKKMKKAPALLAAVMENREFKRQDVERLINTGARGTRMLSVFAMEDTSDFTVKKVGKAGKAGGKPKKSAKAVDKEPKADTKALSLELHKAGKTLTEIAGERKMVIGTIEGHLAHYVAKQEISAKDVIGARKLDKILEAIKALKTLQMNPIRAHLGREYSFGEIKIGLAAHLAEGG